MSQILESLKDLVDNGHLKIGDIISLPYGGRSQRSPPPNPKQLFKITKIDLETEQVDLELAGRMK